MTALRYLLYLAFVAAAVVFWLLVAVFVLGFSLGDPHCAAYGPCPETSALEYALYVLVVFGAIPATALAFYFYRRAVRRMLSLD